MCHWRASSLLFMPNGCNVLALEALQNAVYDHATYIHLSDLIDNMAFNLRNNLDLRRFTKLKRLKRILPSQADAKQDTPRNPATSNSLPINNSIIFIPGYCCS